MVHTYQYKDVYLALDVESGSVHVLSQLAYDAINALNAGKPLSCLTKDASNSEINEVMAEIAELKKQGTLFSEMEYTPDDIKSFDPVAKALCLNVTTGCNLRCEYCFASAGHVPHENMSFEVAKQALEFLISSSEDRINLEVDFFGGEPTLNFDVIKQTVEYGRQREGETGKKFRFTVTTNGYYLTDEMLNFFDAEMKNIVISMDGRKEIHDKIRITAGGGPSYDRVLENAKKIVQKRGDKEYYVRGTYTQRNLDFSKDVIAMYDAGFKEVSIEPVVTSGALSLTEADLPKIFEEYEALAEFL
ncbi:MAG: radical SAM protein, partial [Eubacteriales bacterium]